MLAKKSRHFDRDKIYMLHKMDAPFHGHLIINSLVFTSLMYFGVVHASNFFQTSM